MKGNFSTLTELAAEIERQESVKNDFIASTQDLSMREDRTLEVSGAGAFELTDHASGQIADRLSIPRKFYNGLPERAEGLRTDIVNRLLSEQKESRMIRTLDGNARAYLSDQYRPYDNMMMLSSMLPALQQFPEVTFRSNALSETRMYVQMLFPATETRIGDLLDYHHGDHRGSIKAYSKEAEALIGEALMFGVTLRNSEVGNGALEVSQTVFSLWCSNLAIGESIIKKAHLGRRLQESDFGNFKSDTIAADIEAFRLMFRDVLSTALEETSVKASLAKYAGAALDAPVEDPVQTVKNVTERYGFTETEAKQIEKNFLTDGRPMNQFGLGNALTALARELEDPDRGYEIEKQGFEILTLKPNQWEKLSA